MYPLCIDFINRKVNKFGFDFISVPVGWWREDGGGAGRGWRVFIGLCTTY